MWIERTRELEDNSQLLPGSGILGIEYLIYLMVYTFLNGAEFVDLFNLCIFAKLVIFSLNMAAAIGAFSMPLYFCL